MNRQEGLSLNRVRMISFAVVALLHLILIFFVVFRIETYINPPEPVAGVMKLMDLREEIPPPPPPPPPPPERKFDVPEEYQSEFAETMIETDETPPPITHEYLPVIPIIEQPIEYLPQYKISVLPVLPDDQIRRATVYPPIAQRSGVEGTVYLDLFIDSQGFVRNVIILKETPLGRGFGEAAVNAFKGIHGKPAEANGVPVAARYRYNISFKLN